MTYNHMVQVGEHAMIASGSSSALNITSATVVKAAAGRIVKISVVTPGIGAGAVHDCATTGAAAASNKIASVPNLATTVNPVINIDWPCLTGIVVVPGTSQVLAVSFT